METSLTWKQYSVPIVLYQHIRHVFSVLVIITSMITTHIEDSPNFKYVLTDKHWNEESLLIVTDIFFSIIRFKVLYYTVYFKS